MHFIKQVNGLCFEKLGIKYASKGEVGLAVLKALWELLLAVLILGLGLTVEHLLVLLLGYSAIYGTHKRAHNK